MIHIIVFLCFYFLSFGFSGSVTSRFGFDVALYSLGCSHMDRRGLGNGRSYF